MVIMLKNSTHYSSDLNIIGLCLVSKHRCCLNPFLLTSIKLHGSGEFVHLKTDRNKWMHISSFTGKPLHHDRKVHTTASAPSNRINKTPDAMPPLQPGRGIKHEEAKRAHFLPGKGLDDGVGRELKVQNGGGVEVNAAEHLYLQG